jgi:hypothetical protein
MKRKQEDKARHDQLVRENKQFELKLEKSNILRNGTKKRSNKGPTRKTKISKGDVGRLKGHIGSFSNGVLKLKSNDIKKFNSSSNSKAKIRL